MLNRLQSAIDQCCTPADSSTEFDRLMQVALITLWIADTRPDAVRPLLVALLGNSNSKDDMPTEQFTKDMTILAIRIVDGI